MQMVLPISALEPIFQDKNPNTRTLCQRRKECGTRKFKGISNGKSLQRQLPQWYHSDSSCVKKRKNAL
jgi:hypothetical protein